MGDRVSQTILLCEDDMQERLVRSYLKVCGLQTGPPQLLVRNASREVHGGNIAWVLREFPRELAACRKRHASHAKTLLVVVADADDYTVVQRRSHLVADPAVVPSDPLVALIPRRHVETWIRAATGQTVGETDDCKHPAPGKEAVRAAATAIHGWARDNPPAGPTCVPSLGDALPGWRRIG